MQAPGETFWGTAPAGLGELLKRVHELELIARKNAHGMLRGDYVTNIPGSGLEFREARRYVFGESIRQIDWNMTARMGNPYVRVYQEEREREIFVVLDVSPSMHAGWQSRRKIEYATEIAATLAWSAVASGDKLGFITYADRVLESSVPRKGKAQFFRAVKTFYAAAVGKPKKCDVSDMRQAIHQIQGLRGRRFMIFFLSDFVDFDIPDDLRYLQARHDVRMIHLYDPLEYRTDDALSFLSFSPEGKRRTAALARAGEDRLPAMRRFLYEESAKLGVRYTSISTATPMQETLHDLFLFARAAL